MLAHDTRGGILIAWDQDLVWGGAVVLKTYCLSLEGRLKAEQHCVQNHSGRHARIFRWTMKAEQALLVEIKSTCQLWSLAGAVFSKPLFVAQISNM
jgi:hypothetical protein